MLENVEAPLQARGVDPEERRSRSMRMLDTVGLDGFEGAYPKELSGGMKQRVGFARALVVEPEVLFMDEPFSALDVLTAENLRSELLELWANKTMPTKAVFLVTHNIEEAVLLADRIIVLGRNPGHIRTDFKVQLPQPRDRKSEPFTQLVDYIYKVLTKPDVAPAEAPDQQAGTKVRDQRQMHYQMLPHARPGGMAGLLELLLDKGGRDDIYRLADDLAFEIDDLLPIVDAAQLLGFLKIDEGDAAITETAPSLPIPKSCARKNYSAPPLCRTSCCFARFAARSKPRAITPFPKTSFWICSTSSSARMSAFARWKPPSPGAATPSYSTTTRVAGALSCPTRTMRSLPPAREPSEAPAHPFAVAGNGTHLAVRHRSRRGRLWPGDFLHHREHRLILVGQACPRGPHLSLHRRAAGVCLLLHRAHRYRLPDQPDVCHQLRLYRGL